MRPTAGAHCPRCRQKLFEIALTSAQHHDTGLLFGPRLVHGALQVGDRAIRRCHGNVGHRQCGAVAKRFADGFEIKGAARAGKKRQFLDFLPRCRPVAAKSRDGKRRRIIRDADSVPRHCFTNQPGDVGCAIGVASDCRGVLAGLEQFHQRMPGGCLGGLDDDEGIGKAAGQRDLAGRQHFTASSLHQHKAAGSRHRKGFCRVTKCAGITGKKVALKPGYRKHILKIAAVLRGQLPATLGDKAEVIAMKQDSADVLRHRRQKGCSLTGRNLHQESGVVK